MRWIEIDLAAIEHNVRLVRRLIGPRVRFWAVVKGDGYGHGAVEVGKVALASGADGLAATYLDEALGLRAGGIRGPILVMGPVDPRDAGEAVRHRLEIMVDNPGLLKSLERHAHGRSVAIHAKLDLGLRRWGVGLADLPALLDRIGRAEGVNLSGLFAHPGYMAGRRMTETGRALRRLGRAGEVARQAFPQVCLHAACSAVLLDFPEHKLDGVRVGNLIYGINPTGKALDLKNPWRARARLVRLTKVRRGERVGYGSFGRAGRDTVVGTVPVGYAHGLGLALGGPGVARTKANLSARVGDQAFPFIGRVGMMHALIDLGPRAKVRPGDIVDLPVRRTAAALWPRVYPGKRSP